MVTINIDCSVLNRVCAAWGDPHITTLDGIYYHPQGTGYYYYITECENGGSLPFEINGYQEPCNGAFTCVREVIIEIDNKRISFLGSGSGMHICLSIFLTIFVNFICKIFFLVVLFGRCLQKEDFFCCL